MTDSPMAAGMSPAAFTSSGRSLSLPGLGHGHSVERERLIARARDTDVARQLQRCFPRWLNAFEHLAWPALVRLAANQPVDPNDPDAWQQSRDAHANAVLRRHGHVRTPVADVLRRSSRRGRTGLVRRMRSSADRPEARSGRSGRRLCDRRPPTARDVKVSRPAFLSVNPSWRRTVR